MRGFSGTFHCNLSLLLSVIRVLVQVRVYVRVYPGPRPVRGPNRVTALSCLYTYIYILLRRLAAASGRLPQPNWDSLMHVSNAAKQRPFPGCGHQVFTNPPPLTPKKSTLLSDCSLLMIQNPEGPNAVRHRPGLSLWSRYSSPNTNRRGDVSGIDPTEGRWRLIS